MTTKKELEDQIVKLNEMVSTNEHAVACAIDEMKKIQRNHDQTAEYNRQLQTKVDKLERKIRDLVFREERYEKMIDYMLDQV